MIGHLKLSEHSVDIGTFKEHFPRFQVVSVQRIFEGSNSQVYRLQAQHGKMYVAKFYFRHEAQTRDRLGTEYLSLSLLWKYGFRCIPQPLAINESIGCALYDFIEGKKILPCQLTGDDIRQCVLFLERLKLLANETPKSSFQPASEACFSAQEIFHNIYGRLNRLEASSNHHGMRDFLTNDFRPFFKRLITWYEENSVDVPDIELADDEKTLSPSDFGFHNAVKMRNGNIVFMDFEYFGWDDPAKMVSDFLLHPAMSLSQGMKEKFLSDLCRSTAFSNAEGLLQRIKLVYPFFGLKWCLIFLNEFVSDDSERRNFAQAASINKMDVKNMQLSKARRALNCVKESYSSFPFSYATR